jgi:hypothetical protein
LPLLRAIAALGAHQWLVNDGHLEVTVEIKALALIDPERAILTW